MEAGLTLRGLAGRSDGRFKPSAVGAYERAERALTVDRFVELCVEYGAPPERVLARALEIAGRARGPGAVIDLTEATLVDEPAGPGPGA